jgi:hypothetical protein
MRNIFLLYMPPGNAEAMVHYQDTVRNKVVFDRIAPHLSSALARKLQQVFGSNSIAVWGSCIFADAKSCVSASLAA